MVFFFFLFLASIHLAENMITDPLHGFLVTVQMLEERIIFIFPDSSRRNLGSILVRYPLGTILYGPKVDRPCWHGCWGSTPVGQIRATSREGNRWAGERSCRHPHHLCPMPQRASSSQSLCVCLCQHDPWLSKLTLNSSFPGGLNSFHSCWFFFLPQDADTVDTMFFAF